MTEFAPGPVSPFKALEGEVSAELVANDAVFRLAAPKLQFGQADNMTPAFMLRPYYGGKLPDELAAEGLRPSEVTPATLQVASSGSATIESMDEVSIGPVFYDYIELGAILADSSRLWVYDAGGRLHEVPRGEEGFVGSKDGPYEADRLIALPAWQNAHNRMIRAAREQRGMWLDGVAGIWTDQQPGNVSLF